MRFSPILPEPTFPCPTNRRWRPPDFVYSSINTRRSAQMHAFLLNSIPTRTNSDHPPSPPASIPSVTTSSENNTPTPSQFPSSCSSPSAPSQTSVPSLLLPSMQLLRPLHTSDQIVNQNSINPTSQLQPQGQNNALSSNCDSGEDGDEDNKDDKDDDDDDDDEFVDAEENLPFSDTDTQSHVDSEIQPAPVPPSPPRSQKRHIPIPPLAIEQQQEKIPLLPPPSTTRRPPQQPHIPRTVPLFLALVVAVSMLAYLTSTFFDKLTVIDAALRAQTDTHNTLYFTPEDTANPTAPHALIRRPSSLEQSHGDGLSLWGRLSFDVYTVFGILRRLSEYDASLAPTALLFAAVPRHPQIHQHSRGFKPSANVHVAPSNVFHLTRPQNPIATNSPPPPLFQIRPQHQTQAPYTRKVPQTSFNNRSDTFFPNAGIAPQGTHKHHAMSQNVSPQPLPPAAVLPGVVGVVDHAVQGPLAIAQPAAGLPQAISSVMPRGPPVFAKGGTVLGGVGVPPNFNELLYQGSLNVINAGTVDRNAESVVIGGKSEVTHNGPLSSTIQPLSTGPITRSVAPLGAQPALAPALAHAAPRTMQQKASSVQHVAPRALRNAAAPAISALPQNPAKPPPITTAKKPPQQQAVPAFPMAVVQSDDSIEVWNLPHGRSLCRLFNVARMADGQLLLPKWMEKHEQFLSDRCSISNAIFALDKTKGRFHVDGKAVKKELKHGYSIDFRFRDLDLFSHETPRHHMPHYVSDIIKPLVAVEVLMGSGRNMLAPLSLLRTEKSTKLVRSVRGKDPLNPALLTLPESLKGPAANWVRRMGSFFTHSALGFVMIPVQRKQDVSSVEKAGRITVFHSVLSSNVNPYEPYGLFGTTGKNIVFMANDISRDPPWTMPSVREYPCRVSITALTRKGARALLSLDVLEKGIESKAAAHNMRANFRVVDFTDTAFEKQVRIMQETNVLIATHGAGNANIIFMRPGAAFVEVFPFAYKAGPFDGFAKIFGLEYSTAMSAPQTDVFKTCMNEHEKNDFIRRLVFEKWDRAVQDELQSPWVHRLEFEKEFGEPGKSQGMTTRGCVRLQQLQFNVDAVANTAISAGKSQCFLSKTTKLRE